MTDRLTPEARAALGYRSDWPQDAPQTPTITLGGTGSAVNTDRELWRERDGDFYADSIHVTKDGAIGINVGGHVIVKSVQEWHALARAFGR